MKVAILNINSDLLLGKNSKNTIKILTKKFLELGVEVSKILTITNAPNIITKELINIEENFIIVLGESSSIKNFNIKKALASTYNLNLSKSDECVNIINNYYKNANIPTLSESENEFYIPQNSEIIYYPNSPLIPFCIKQNKHIVFLPNNENLINYVFDNFIKLDVSNFYKINYKTQTIKTFGIAEKDVKILINEFLNNKYKILIETYSEHQVVSILIRYNVLTDKFAVQQIISRIYEKLNRFIFADENVTLTSRAVDLLELTKNSIAIAENCTAGRIVSELSKYKNALEYLTCAYTICNKNSLIKTLNINPEIINSFGMSSVETAYEIAYNLIQKTNSDIVICTTELMEIGNNSYNTFISIGDSDGIHVYKCTFSGDKEEVLNNITQTTIFYLIKKLKQNDLIFSQTTL